MALTLLAVGAMHTGPVASNDYGFHLRLGAQIVETGSPPQTDHHSYTAPGAPYLDHEWLAQVLMHVGRESLGDGGMVAVKGILVLATAALMLFSVRGPIELRLLMALLMALLGLHHSQVRPHILFWLLAAAQVALLERRRFIAVLLMLVPWANLHGSILLGVAITGLYALEAWVETRRRRYLLFGMLSVLIPLANPYGARIYELFARISSHTHFVGEWRPYDKHDVAFWLDVALFAVAGLAAWARVVATRAAHKGNMRRTAGTLWGEWVRLAVLASLAFSSSRHGVIAAVYLAPSVARGVGPWLERRRARHRLLAAAACVLIAVSVFVGRYHRAETLRFEVNHQALPVAAVRFLKEQNVPGPVFNDYNFGGTLLWLGYPHYPVFIDGRLEVYAGSTVDTYLKVSKARPGFERVLERYGVKSVLVRPERNLAKMLMEMDAWDIAYFDYNSVLFIRRGIRPDIKRLTVVTPFGHRDRTQVDTAYAEISYILQHNERFFGGYKIKAFLAARRGDFGEAAQLMQRYLALAPSRRLDREAQSLISTLEQRGAWPGRS